MADRAQRRKAAAKRSKDRKGFPRVTRTCEDCGATLTPSPTSYDPVICEPCLKIHNELVRERYERRQASGAA